MKGILSIAFIGTILINGYFTFPDPNHAPQVKIVQPSNNGMFQWNSQMPYSIDVSDKEDGDSKYQEIQSTEVLVKLQYFENVAKASDYLRQKKFSDTVGVISMLASNCFSCHDVKKKMAGPSFSDIGMKYPNIPIYRDQLVSHIKKGVSGIWGKETMPSHPELTDSAIKKMVRWIMNYAKDPKLNYSVGLQGVISLAKISGVKDNGVFIMMAFYTDHGSDSSDGKKLTGFDQVLVRMK